MNDMAVWWPTRIQDRNLKSRIPHPLDLLGKGADRLITSTPPRFTSQKCLPMGWNTGFFRDLYMQSQAWGSIEYPECNEDRWGHVSCIECDSEYDDRKHLVSRAQIEQRHRKPNIPAPLQVCDASSPPGLPTHACLSTHSAGTPTNPTVRTRQKW